MASTAIMGILRLLLALFLSIYSLDTFTQNKFLGGAHAGLTTSQIDGDGYAGFNKVGFTLGFNLTHKLKDRLDLLAELSYTTKGSFDPANFQIGKINSQKIALSYLELPLLLSFKVKKIYINSGFSFGALVSEKQYRNGVELPEDQYTIGPFNAFEAAYLLGLEYKFSDQWGIMWRHSFSVTPVANRLNFDKSFFRLVGGAFSQSMSLTLRRTFSTNQ